MQNIKFPDIPKSWLVAFLIVALVVMRAFGIDSWTTAGLSSMIGYIIGKDQGRVLERTFKKK